MNSDTYIFPYNNINWHYLLKIQYFKDYFNQEELTELSKLCKRFRNLLKPRILNKVYFNNDPEFAFNKRLKSNYSNGYPSIPEGEMKGLFENYKNYIFEEERTINGQLEDYLGNSSSLHRRITHFTIRHSDNFYLINLPSFENITELCLYNTYMLKNDFLKIFSSINLLLKLSLVQVQVIYFDGDVINLDEIKLPSNLKVLEINEAYLQNQITNENTDKTQFPGDEGIEDYGYITPDLDTANIFPYYLNFMNTGLVSRFINSNPKLTSLGIDLVIKHNQNLELFRNLTTLPTINFDCGECDLNIEQFRFPPLVSVTSISFSNILDHHHRYIEKLVLNCPNLTSLQVDMDGKFMMRSFISLLKQSSKLKSLTITNIMSKPIFNIYLGQHPNLECLNLEFFPISCIDLSKFDKLPKLKVVNLLKTNSDPNLRKAKNILRGYANWYCIDSYKSISCYSINHYSHAKLKKMSENFRVKINTKRALKDHKAPFRIIENFETKLSAQSEIASMSQTLKATTKATQPGPNSKPQAHKIVQTVKIPQSKLGSVPQAHIIAKTSQLELNCTLQTHTLDKSTPKKNVYTLIELSKYFSETKNRTSCRVKIDSAVELKKYLSKHDDQKRFKVSLPTEHIISAGINDEASNLKSEMLNCNGDLQDTSHQSLTKAILNKKNMESDFENNNAAQLFNTQFTLINSETRLQDESNIEKQLPNNTINNGDPSYEYIDVTQLNIRKSPSFEATCILSQDQLQIANDELATPDKKDLCNTLINLKETSLGSNSKIPLFKHKTMLNSEAVNIENNPRRNLSENIDYKGFEVSETGSNSTSRLSRVSNSSSNSEDFPNIKKIQNNLQITDKKIESKESPSESLDSSSCENLDSDSEISSHESEFSSQSQDDINFKTFEILESSSDYEDCPSNQKIQYTSQVANKNTKSQLSLTESLNSKSFEISGASSDFTSHLTEISSKKSSQEFQVSNYQTSSDISPKQIEFDEKSISIESDNPIPEDTSLNHLVNQSITSETQNISNSPASFKATELGLVENLAINLNSDQNEFLVKTPTDQGNSNCCIDNKAHMSNGETSLLIDLTLEDESENIQETSSGLPVSERSINDHMLEPSFAKKSDNKQQFKKHRDMKGLYSYFSNIPSIFNLKGHLTKNLQQQESTRKIDPRRKPDNTAEKSGSQKETATLDSDSE
ncbi:hypothetical protein CONCODRAFT_78730 [Conidiobolus coronatus NRRL 28638]|uniref:Uncharacterized protein n=1 Tax=Conidiobolus coronatus (strain ATCC 28846 / CBS 209.66 / NRRL 28638) TaxID=796925 RepID=A0A137P6L6_CONC2|nr:hypothetical protein CONCODRAFT_78730 [Conidiobolus coronatus NRRL 28638]|eukprot:KXN70660.1 hypothetical protein CONCODRAFT_78730 [Conidiobolus coronatus NRRL 28638]